MLRRDAKASEYTAFGVYFLVPALLPSNVKVRHLVQKLKRSDSDTHGQYGDLRSLTFFFTISRLKKSHVLVPSRIRSHYPIVSVIEG